MPVVGAVGYFVNSVALYGWSDATSYNNLGVRCLSLFAESAVKFSIRVYCVGLVQIGSEI
jgi:hypothetical protein